MVGLRKRVGKRLYAPPSRYHDGGASRKKKRKVGTDEKKGKGRRRVGKRSKRAQAAQARAAVTPQSRAKAAATRLANEEFKRAQEALLKKRSLGLGERHAVRSSPLAPSVVVVESSKKRERSQKDRHDKGTRRTKEGTRRTSNQMRGVKKKLKWSPPDDDGGLEFGLTLEQRNEFDAWVKANNDVDGAPPLTVSRMQKHLRDTYGAHWGEGSVRHLLHSLDYEYEDPGSGYLEGRRSLESSEAHARFFLPLIELLEADPRFLIVYYDESNPNVNQFRTRAWVKSKAVATPEERKRRSRKPGKGQALNVSGAVSADFGGFVTDEDGVHIGSFLDRGKARAAGEKHTADSDSFKEAILAIVDRVQAVHPNRICVVFMDSPNVHRKSEEKKAQRAVGMNRRDIEVKLTMANKWIDGMSLDQARKAYAETPEEYEALLDNLTDVEALLYEKGALVIFNINSQAMLNTVERYWRAANQHYKKSGGSSLKELQRAWCGVLDGEPSAETFNRRHMYSQEFRRFMFHHPKGSMIDESDVRHRAYKAQPRIPCDALQHLLGLDAKSAVNFDLVFAYCHYVNSARINGPVKGYEGMVLTKAPRFAYDSMGPRWRKSLNHRLALLRRTGAAEASKRARPQSAKGSKTSSMAPALKRLKKDAAVKSSKARKRSTIAPKPAKSDRSGRGRKDSGKVMARLRKDGRVAGEVSWIDQIRVMIHYFRPARVQPWRCHGQGTRGHAVLVRLSSRRVLSQQQGRRLTW